MFKPYRRPLSLQTAAKLGCLTYIEENIGEIKNQDHRGRTGLMFAALYNQPKAAKLLLEETKLTDINGMTALMLACRTNNVKVTEMLLLSEARMMDNCGTTALMQAAFEGSIDCVKLMLSSEGGMVSAKDGKTALMCAAIRGNYECVKLLLDLEGGKKTTDYGLTALMLCAKSTIASDEKKIKCIKLLITREAKILDSEGCNAFDYIVNSDTIRPDTETYKYLKKFLGESGNRKDKHEIDLKNTFLPMATNRIF